MNFDLAIDNVERIFLIKKEKDDSQEKKKQESIRCSLSSMKIGSSSDTLHPKDSHLDDTLIKCDKV